MQRCTLLSIKTGGCPETCNYCSQSSSWSKDTGLKAEKLMQLEEVYAAALRAKEAGSTRFCMGAAWRGPSQVGGRGGVRIRARMGAWACIHPWAWQTGWAVQEGSPV